VHRGILEAAEPGQDQMQVVSPRARDQAVHDGEIELPSHRFDGLPLNRNLDGVDMQPFRERPGSFQLAGIPARIGRLDAKHDEGPIVDLELIGAAFFDQPRHRFGAHG
jgi:hypothetical protein